MARITRRQGQSLVPDPLDQREGPLVRLEGEYVGDLGAGRVGGGVSGRVS